MGSIIARIPESLLAGYWEKNPAFCLRCGVRSWGIVERNGRWELDCKALLRNGCDCGAAHSKGCSCTETEIVTMSKVAKKMSKKVVGKPEPVPVVNKKTVSKPQVPGLEGGELGAVLSTGSVNSIHVQIGRTVKLADFESLRVDYGETHVVNEGDTHEATRERALESVLNAVEEIIGLARPA